MFGRFAPSEIHDRGTLLPFSDSLWRDCLKIPNEPHRGAPPRGRDGVESVISQPRVPPNTRAQETCSDFSDSLSTKVGEWGSKEGLGHQEAPTLTAEHVPSGQ